MGPVCSLPPRWCLEPKWREFAHRRSDSRTQMMPTKTAHGTSKISHNGTAGSEVARNAQKNEAILDSEVADPALQLERSFRLIRSRR